MNWAEELVGKMSEMHESGKVVEELSRSRKGELFVLRYLYNKNAAATPSELSEALDSSTARISAALKSLEKKGQIKREIDKSNRRFILVTLTVAGREYIRIRLNQMKEHMTQVLTEMGEADAREFVRLSAIFFDIAWRTMPDIANDN